MKEYTNENQFFDRKLIYPIDAIGEYIEDEGVIEDFEEVHDTLWSFDVRTKRGLFHCFWDGPLHMAITPGNSTVHVRLYSWGGSDNRVTEIHT